jgi:hypothetical protein
MVIHRRRLWLWAIGMDDPGQQCYFTMTYEENPTWRG